MGERATRIPVNIKAIYYLKNSEGEGRIVDISTGGIGMEVRQIFVSGDLVRIVFRIPDQSNVEIDFWGIVRNVTGNLVGINFEEISNENREKIDKYVTNLLLQSGKGAKESF
ncbi:MAG: PilZ domain-containing protein [Brevinematales bacterium]|nr:PilZ domain-containing protein [Brevinematales bacterium]